jgi:hypothetical protein
MNTVRIILKVSLPLQLNNHNFGVNFSSLATAYYSFNVVEQDQSDLTAVSVDISYERDIQDQ